MIKFFYYLHYNITVPSVETWVLVFVDVSLLVSSG